MVRIITATETKAKLLSLLDKVSAGEEFEVTRHGRTIARIVPARGPSSLRGKLSGIASTTASEEDLFSTGLEWDLP